MSDFVDEPKELTPAQREAIAEVKTLARILADNYGEYVVFLVKHMERSLQDAIMETNAKPAQYIERVLNESPKQVSWLGLNSLEPEQALKRWGEIKEAALDEILSGHYAADQFNTSPYDRARFLAIRAAFNDQWKPQNAGEQMLTDMLAQLFMEYVSWLSILHSRQYYETERERDYGQIRESGKLKPMHIDAAEAEEHAAEMVDRFNRLFLRTLRALRDLRRYSQSIMIQNAGQVNIGAQQVNAAKIEREEKGEDE